MIANTAFSFLSSLRDSIKYCSWYMTGPQYASYHLFALPLHSSSKTPYNANRGIWPIADVHIFSDMNCKGMLIAKNTSVL